MTGTLSAVIENPVLRGFHPDPSILRVGGTYYLATSTFEWWPGVRVHRSDDLVTWTPCGHLLNEERLLRLGGVPDSGGIWAPHLSHDGERFHLVYTVVQAWGDLDAPKDSPNYHVSAPALEGPWSDPVYLTSGGFDPSLHFTPDGRAWLLYALWDHRPGFNAFPGIAAHEYDPPPGRLVGERRLVYTGTSIGLTEGPHLYERDGWFYLVVAEGGTSYRHAVTVARSRQPLGPYETHPGNPLLTSVDSPDLPLQKAGHASLVDTPDGEWYLAHLCGRPLARRLPNGRRPCPLGRETALQALTWGEDGWPRLAQGGNAPRVAVPAPPAARPRPRPAVWRDDFDGPTLGDEWQTLRAPATPEWCDLGSNPGWLRLRGRAPLNALDRQSLVGRRLDELRAEARTRVRCEPRHFQHSAGLALYYDTANWLSLSVSRGDQGLLASVTRCHHRRYAAPLGRAVRLAHGDVHLRVRYLDGDATFSVSENGEAWEDLATVDASFLCDEVEGGLGFTGTFVALWAQDLEGLGFTADFDFLEYRTDV